MKFFFPDSLDLVDPEFDFEREQNAPYRVRHRTDCYAHELLQPSPYHGILVSKSIVDPVFGKERYTEAQRQRLKRTGVRRFFRLDQPGGEPLESMGDCGAYAYVHEERPPFSVEDVMDFYEDCDFDYVLSVDHVIPGFHLSTRPAKKKRKKPLRAWKARQELTLALAEAFLKEHQARGYRSIPIGVAQAWNPDSYALAVRALQHMGYDYVALGGLASLATDDILSCVDAAHNVMKQSTRIHLLGVARTEHLSQLARWGVVSFDSTMPLRQAFMDDQHNYHTLNDAYLAIRVPQVLGNTQLKRQIQQGAIISEHAKSLERACLDALVKYDEGCLSINETLKAVQAYELLFNGRDQTEAYRRLLDDRPWKKCSCALCQALGIQIVLFRGRERNKRRGFHNMHVLFRKLELALG